jgi:predicted nucleotidyltransferase
MKTTHISIPEDALRAFCERHRVKKLALFGSVVRDDFTPESDIDVLVEFALGEPVGLIRLGTIEAELSDLLGRHVDLNLPDMLSHHFRDEVLAEAETLYRAA